MLLNDLKPYAGQDFEGSFV